MFCPLKYWKMLDNTYLTASIFQPVPFHPGCAFAQIEQAVPDDVLKPFSFGDKESRVRGRHVLL